MTVLSWEWKDVPRSLKDNLQHDGDTGYKNERVTMIHGNQKEGMEVGNFRIFLMAVEAEK